MRYAIKPGAEMLLVVGLPASNLARRPSLRPAVQTQLRLRCS
jgi:hypothetical protein